MPERADHNRRRAPRWGFLLAVVAAAFLAPDARAGCGDYVVVVPAEPSASDPPAPARPTEPCHGPYCSRQPDPAPLAPVAPPAPPVEQAACVFPDAAPPAAGGGRAVAPPLAFDPVTRPYRPERPPRR